jgi:predicted ester cyclase
MGSILWRERRVGKEEAAAVSSEAEENKALVRRFLAAEFKWNTEALDEILAPDFVDHSLPGEPGPKGYLRAMAAGRAPFSEFHHNIEDQVAEGDKVVTRITGRATHDRREAMGVAPTGEEYEGSGIIIHRVVGGKIAEQWREWSGGSLLMGLRLEEEARQRERIEQHGSSRAYLPYLFRFLLHQSSSGVPMRASTSSRVVSCR